jgi:TRAP-type mannitol/chloroaromatic compound transport system substrate-binding protein
LRNEGTVKILKLDDMVLKELYRASKDVVAEAASGDELSKKIYASYREFFTLIIDWSDIADGARRDQPQALLTCPLGTSRT